MLKAIKNYVGSKPHPVRFLAFAFFLVITLLLLVPSFQWAFTQLAIKSGNKFVVGIKIRELDEDDYKRIDLPKWQESYITKFDIPLILVSVDYIFVPENAIDDKPICIDKLTVRNLEPKDKFVESILVQSTDLNLVCLNTGKNYLIQNAAENNEDIQAFIYNSYTNPFWYPFDERIFKFHLQLKAFYSDKPEDDDKFTISPIVASQTTPPTWFSRVDISQKPDGEELKIILTRFPFYKVLSVLMPSGVVLIIALLVYFRQDIDGFWEVIVGLIFGIWGLSEVLIPSYIDFPTIIETILLLLFVPLGLFVIHDVWLYFLEKRPSIRHRQRATSEEIEENQLP